MRYTPSIPGKITSINVAVDDTVVIDQVIAVVEQGEFASEAPKADAKASSPPKVERLASRLVMGLRCLASSCPAPRTLSCA